jgi:phosphoribosylformylglycinamidine synthase subunit PurQ / glutaminase
MKPRVLILHATGTNRDREAAWAVEAAGGEARIVHVNELHARRDHLHAFQMLVLPGGFSYGDALGAGRMWATDLRWLFQDELGRFIEAGKPVLGICNGFQALVKSGWLPGPPENGIQVTLTRNASNRFECRWVWLAADPASPCLFTQGLAAAIYCPVAHGEGRFVPRDEAALQALRAQGLIALTYVANDGREAGYPGNPNGSVAGIAAICNERGNVLGLMPHPEDHILPVQHPRWTRGGGGNLGLPLFVQGIRYAAGQ